MHGVAKSMRPYILIFILLAAAMSPLIDLSDNGALAEQNVSTSISGVAISPTSGSISGGENLTITGNGFLDLASNSITNDGLTHAWSMSIADSIQGGYGANAIGVSSNGDVHIVYFNYDTRQLKHAVYDGQSWSRSVISTASAGSQYRYVELQIDDNDNLHVAHWVTGDYLHYRTYNGTSWDLNYTTSNVDSYGVSLALNSLNHAHIAFSTPGYVCSGLNLAYYDAATSAWTKINPDSTSTSTYNGCYPAIGIDSNDAVHITYRDHSNSRHNYITNESGPWDKYQLSNTNSPAYYNDLEVKSNDDIFIIQRNSNGIRYAEGTPGGTWTQGGVYSNNGEENSLILDANDNPHLIHWHSSYDDLMYSTRSSSGTWSTVTIDSGSDDTGRRNSVTIDDNHRIHVAYADVNNKQLKYATKATGLVNDYTIDVQFGGYGNVTATVVSDTLMYVNTPAASSTGNVSLGLWDSSGTYHSLNVNYYYTNPNDTDEDGIENSQDDCPNTAGTSTIDQVGCPDDDGDGYSNSGDEFPNDSSEWADSDGDGAGDNSDAFPDDASETSDADGDGVGDNADAFPDDSSETTDTDGDGVGDNSDAFPNNASETTDSDGDGFGDSVDQCPNSSGNSTIDLIGCVDSDGDGYSDSGDQFPNDSSEWMDSDGDGVGDNADAFPNDASETTDTDGDGVGDNSDEFPNDPSETTDSDGDGVGDNADAFPDNAFETTDSDGDGVGDNADAFPNDPTETRDSDGDGVGDNSDAFPNNAYETMDSDGDGVGDNSDAFPNDSTESRDTDGDGYGDNIDVFPTNPNEWFDSDGDGVGDNSDAYPNDASRTSDSNQYPYTPPPGDNDGQNSTEPGDTDAGTIPSVGILATVVAILFAVIPKRKNEL